MYNRCNTYILYYYFASDDNNNIYTWGCELMGCGVVLYYCVFCE